MKLLQYIPKEKSWCDTAFIIDCNIWLQQIIISKKEESSLEILLKQDIVGLL